MTPNIHQLFRSFIDNHNTLNLQFSANHLSRIRTSKKAIAQTPSPLKELHFNQVRVLNSLRSAQVRLLPFLCLNPLIVGLNVALKGPFPLVRESELSRFGLFYLLKNNIRNLL
jgi:hypothetical protein